MGYSTLSYNKAAKPRYGSREESPSILAFGGGGEEKK